MNKKNERGYLYPFFKENKRFLKRLVFFLLTAFVLQSATTVYAQLTRIDLNIKQTTVKDMLKQIESKTDYSFFYNDAEINTGRLVDVQAKNEAIDQIIKRILPECDMVVENKKIILMLSKMTADSGSDQSSNHRVSGKIVDNFGNPLIGVNVAVEGTTRGAISDIDGNYSLPVEPNGRLIFSYIGYIAQTIDVNNRQVIKITLLEDAQLVDEIVVVGFAKQKKANLTGSVSNIKMADVLGDRPITTTGNLLQGTIPGLQATVGSGEPGAGFSFNIRGATGLGDNTAPLVVIDNIPMSGAIELLNPEDIESITVLKDGGAAAIYGARSAFGVILITTKGAVVNERFQINYNNNFTFTNPWALPKKASPLDAVQAYKDMGLQTTYTGQVVDEWLGYLNNASQYPDGYVINEQGTRYSLHKTDILGDFFGTGFEQKHDISASGGTQSLSYRVSFGYTDQDGVMASGKDRFSRYNFRTFVNAKITNWLKAQVDMSYTKSDKTMPNMMDYTWAVSYPSFVEMIDLEINGELLPAGSPANLAKLGGKNQNARSQNRITGKLIATPVKGLTINAEYTYDDLRRTQTNYSKVVRVTNPPKYEAEVRGGEYSKLSKTHYWTQLSVWNIYASYEKSLGKHNFTGLLGFNQEERHYEYTSATGKDMINDELPSFTLAQEWDPVGDYYSEYALRGYFGRINYNYDSRYLIELNGRYDGSSKFQKGHRWGFFPSVSLGWRLMQEPFMESLIDYIPEFKIRASYSTIGNQQVDPYQFNPNMGGSKAVWIVDGARPTTLGAPGLVSDNFTWETVETYNLGFDISLFRNRFQANVDIYRRYTRDMLTDGMELPAVVGAKAAKQNVADLRSDGFELEFKWNDRIGKVKYYIGANLYNYSTRIIKFDNETGLFNKQNTGDSRRFREGMKLGEIWGYTFDRFYTDADFDEGGGLREGIPYVRGTVPKPGDVLFVDYDDDGLISDGSLTIDDPGDLKIIGNSALKWQYGINGGLTWNNISFSFVLQGVGKRDVWLNNQLTRPFQYEYGTIYQHLLDYWTPDNTNAKYPRLYSTGSRDKNFNANYSTSKRYLDNGAYLRVRNLTLGYTIPKDWLRKANVDKLRVYCSVENPFVFNHLPKGLDPTLTNAGHGMGYPIMRAFSMGFSLTL